MMNSSEFQNQIVSIAPRIYPMVVRILKNENDAADAIQEIMLKLWNKRKSLKKHPNPEGFVFVTARNYCLDIIKKRKIAFDDSANYPESVDTESVELRQDNQEAAKLINSLINDLPDQQKEVIILRDIDGLEFAEISDLTGTKIENIRVQLSRARKTISRRLNEVNNYEYGTLKRSL